MLYEILKRTQIGARILEVGSEVDTDAMTAFSEESLDFLVSQGKARQLTVKKPDAEIDQALSDLGYGEPS